MKSAKDITVIIPAHNAEKTLARAFHSVAAQTMLPAKMIIVDDASSDGTFELIQFLKTNFSTFPILALRMKKNVGAGKTRNYAWEHVETKWIAFLDADDSWHPAKLEVQLNALELNPSIDLICTKSKVWVEGSENLKNDIDIHNLKYLSFAKMLFRNSVATRSVLLRTSIEERFEAGLSEDYDLWLRLLQAGYVLARVEEPLVFSFRHEFSSGGISSRLLLHEYFELKSILGFFSKSPVLVVTALIFSFIKFLRRLIINAIRRVTS